MLESLSKRFSDEGEIGRGGSAVVRRMFDREMQRMVAIKVVHPDLPEIDRRRFGNEALTTARLEHPNIVPVHDIFRDDGGQPYAFAMKLIEGRTLAEMLTSRPADGSALQLDLLLPIFSRVCEALGYAHSRGVVHRDVKPHNVMVGEFGQVYVTDWGLALGGDRTVDADLEREADVSGTLVYMAPEQVESRIEDIDGRTDVFALGALLYETLTGRPPFAGKLSDILDRVRRADVRLPEEVAPHRDMPSELCTIAMKALSRDPDGRYASAIDLRQAVEDFMRRGGWFPRARFSAGDAILREGDAGSTAYIVVQGRCEVVQGSGTDRRTIRELGPGEVFGEVALFTTTTRTASVRALTEVDVLVVRRSALDAELERRTWMSTFFQAAGERFVELDRERTSRVRRD
jgi:serine/threonine-protein kinase